MRNSPCFTSNVSRYTFGQNKLAIKCNGVQAFAHTWRKSYRLQFLPLVRSIHQHLPVCQQLLANAVRNSCCVSVCEMCRVNAFINKRNRDNALNTRLLLARQHF